ncbi:cytochrome b [Protaetiibacter intestinalis]|uniref:Cytochrome bc1 complex cytochrome b subunit n=1 Tax=Protaetiibacter intestinalis TaxID=2419774 RepID=A0A387B9E0_9MICO|nr:cytochrome b N-terminal domain-containing protein [Protaetiibacter intestinalis]AYF98378.1 ubiquinol-cytochrome c reductase cytochrome b subunit [Protaetiibacter intestinalis]
MPRRITDRLHMLLVGSKPGAVAAAIVAWLRERAVPRHWTHWFGVVPPALVVVLFVSGAILTVFYSASGDRTSYHGSYAPLQGVEVSEAFDSVMRLSYDIPGGLLLRQVHHWAALALPAALCIQLAILFFTGGFRRPRRGGWVLLVLVLLLALATGWSGYALPDDLLAGTGLRITQGVALGIPVVGTWISALLFGGGFPGEAIERLAPLHIVVLPVLLLVVLVWRTILVLRDEPPSLPEPPDRPVVREPTWPNAGIRALGLGAIVTGLILLIGATATVGDVGTNGPSDPASAGAGSQPDWYTGFLDGALRLVPPGWEVEWLGGTWTLAVLVPLAVVGIFILIVLLYPFLESWATRDRSPHLDLQRPRNAANRTALGAAGIAFIGTLWAAAAADHLAVLLRLSLEGVLVGFQVLLVLGPAVAFAVVQRLCLGLQRKDLDIVEHGHETGVIVRLPGGEYVEEHAGGGPDELWRVPGGSARPALRR